MWFVWRVFVDNKRSIDSELLLGGYLSWVDVRLLRGMKLALEFVKRKMLLLFEDVER
jgi:hypothetical protein